jgi:hypothetical protein
VVHRAARVLVRQRVLPGLQGLRVARHAAIAGPPVCGFMYSRITPSYGLPSVSFAIRVSVR